MDNMARKENGAWRYAVLLRVVRESRVESWHIYCQLLSTFNVGSILDIPAQTIHISWCSLLFPAVSHLPGSSSQGVTPQVLEKAVLLRARGSRMCRFLQRSGRLSNSINCSKKEKAHEGTFTCGKSSIIVTLIDCYSQTSTLVGTRRSCCVSWKLRCAPQELQLFHCPDQFCRLRRRRRNL